MLRINQFLFDLYSCPTSPGRWSVALDELCRTLRVCSAVVQIIRPEDGRPRSRWMVRDSRSEAARALHDRYFSDGVNPRFLVRRAPPSTDQQVFRDSDIFESNDPLLADLKVRLAAAGLGRYLSARMLMPGNEGLTLVVHRDPNDEQDYTKREERVVLELMPHLRQAIELASTLHAAQRQASDLHETIDSFRFALMICDADGSVCWSNTAAQRILARRQALWLNGSKLLTTHSSKQTTEVRAAIAHAALDASGCSDPQLFALGDNGPSALQIRVQALERPRSPYDTQRRENPEGRALIVLCDPTSEASLPPDLLKRLFGLSPAESRLASALCVGATLNEYAAHAGVTISTARYQLKQVMAKTHVSKQSQLVQRLCSSVAFHMRS
jgi:DNA-binding CsgD family transcriptional regulator